MGFDGGDMIAEFVVESLEHLSDIENQLLTIESGGAEVDRELVNEVFRAVHSVKGASGFLGLTRIGELSHALENVLNLMRNGEMVPSSPTIDVLLRASDALRHLLNNVHASNEMDISAHLDALQVVARGEVADAVRESLDQQVDVGSPGADGPPFSITRHTLESQARVGNRLYILTFHLVADVEEKGRSALSLARALVSLGEVLDARIMHEDWSGLEDGVPSEIRYLALFGTVMEPDMVAEAFEISEDQVREVRDEACLEGDAVAAPESPVVAKSTDVSPESAPPETPSEAPATSSGPAVSGSPSTASNAPSTRPADTSIRVSVNLLDHLMNLAGEMVLSRNQLLQALGRCQDDDLDRIGSRMDQITSELQEAIMQTRMQPIDTVFSKFPRIVRDLCNKLGRQCELVIEGKDVELDKSIIEGIGDPLTHLIRNALDHGVESPEDRARQGKKPTGTLSLQAFHQAGKVNIAICDDGAGIDLQRIKEKAVENRLMTAEQARDISDREAAQLIFHPGLSTAKEVTDVSGRGVGMDVVRTNIEKMGGAVEVETERGVGTSIVIKLPLTLAIIPSLVVRSGDERCAIPQVNINELVRIKPDEVTRRIERIKEAEVLRLRGTLLPLVRLSQVIETDSRYLDPGDGELKKDRRQRIVDRREDADPEATESNESRALAERRQGSTGALNVIVVEAGHLRYGLVVDAVQDSEEIVVKPLGRHLKGRGCLAGATILGDGRVAMILDIAGIAAHTALSMPEGELASEQQAQGPARDNGAQTMLLFSNHPSEQFGVPMGLIARIESLRTDQIDCVGGQELLQYRNTSLPLLTLEQHIKAMKRLEQSKLYVVVSKIAGQEVGLIVPRLVDIREVSGEIDTVTFREPGVAGSLVVEERTTRMIDLVELTRAAHPEWFSSTAATPDRPAARRTKRLLLAEDSSFFRSQLENMLSASGYEVVGCEDGQEAWDTLQDSEQAFDLVVTDIEMPNLDGYELSRRIKTDATLSALPIIAVTSLAGDQDMARGREVGIDEYQVKLDRDLLMDAIKRLLKRTGRPAEAVTDPVV